MADPVSATVAIVDTIQKVQQIADFFKSIKGLFKGKEVIPYTAQELADMSFEQIEQMVNSPNLYGDGGNEGQLEAIEAQFEDAVSKVQGLEESPEKTRLLNEAVRILPRGFTQLTETDIMPDLDALSDTTQDDDDDDDVIDAPATTMQTPEQIYEENKQGTIFDLIAKYPTEEGGEYPFDFVVSILKNAADKGNANAAQILSNTPIAGPEGAFGGDGAAVGTGPASALPTSNVPTGNVPTGNVPTGNVPTGNVPTGNVPTGNVPTGNVPTGNVPAGGVISQDSVLNQSGTGTVNVDDKVPNIFNIPIPGPQGERGERGLQGIQGIAGKNAVPIISTPISDSYLFQMDIPEVPVTRGTLLERAMIADNNWRNIV